MGADHADGTDDEKPDEKASEVLKDKKTPKNPVSDSTQYIWYHPNPWWKIKTAPFPVSADSFQYRMMRPQHGTPLFFHNDSTFDLDTWRNWMNDNKMYNIKEFGGHVWGGAIKMFKDEFRLHPEYLAEIQNVRVGIEKSGKFCVSNQDVFHLFMRYCHEIMKKNPDRKFLSVEPSDGTGFCQCNECTRLGSISNQVFHFAKLVADSMSKSYPDVTVNLYAYNLHSDTPSFRLPPNLVVAVAPAGFQNIYRRDMMLVEWAKHHKNLYLRDYFGIPQWTADLPRIHVPGLLTRTQLIRKLDYKAIVMESGININAAILSVLFNAMWLNPTLKWDTVFDKFLEDCFPKSKIPIKRLFTRWHHHHPLSEDEIKHALYDLNQAQSLASDGNEMQRIRDLQAYVHMFGLYYNWAKDTEDDKALEAYFDYVYLAATRNLVNSNALFKSYERYMTKGTALYNKYVASSKPKEWCPYLDNEMIAGNFIKDLSYYGQEINDYKVINWESVLKSRFDSNSFFKEMTFNLAMRQEFMLLTQGNLNLKIEAKTGESTEQEALITISNQDYSFALTRLAKPGDTWQLTLPKYDIYTISMHRLNRCNMRVRGSFIPIMQENNKLPIQEKAHVFEDNSFRKLMPGEKITHSSPHYFLLNR